MFPFKLILAFSLFSFVISDGICRSWVAPTLLEPTETCLAECEVRCLERYQTKEWDCPLYGYLIAQCTCCQH